MAAGRGRASRARLRAGAVAPLDLPWLLVESDRQPTHVAGVVIFNRPGDAPPDFMDDLYREMSGFDAPSPPFNRRLKRGVGWPWWERRATVRVADHFHRTRLAQPGGRAELEQAVAALHRRRLDRRRPLWDVHLIDGLADDQFALYAKFHHSLVDGVGAIRILATAFSADPDRRGLPPVWAYPRNEHVSRARATRRRDLLHALPGAVSAVVDNYTRPLAARPYSAPACAINSPVSSERTVAMVALDRARLKRLATAISGSVNDAFVVVCATALRSFLLEHGLLPDRALTAAMPVSVRPAGTLSGNAISFAFVSLATDIADHASRAERIVASTQDSKTHFAGLDKTVINAHTVLTMAPLILSQLLGLGSRVPPMFNIVISNVPGPPRRLHYNGAAVADIYPVSLLQSGQALNITALSYVDRLNVTVTGCDARLPDISRLTTLISSALAELEDAFASAQ